MKKALLTLSLALLTSAKLYAQAPTQQSEILEIKKILAVQQAEIQKLKLNSTEIFRGELANGPELKKAGSGFSAFSEKENSNSKVFSVVSEGSVKGLRFLKAGKIIGFYVQDTKKNVPHYSSIGARINDSTISWALDSTETGQWGMITSSFSAQVKKDDVLNFSVLNVSEIDSGYWGVLHVMWQGSLQ